MTVASVECPKTVKVNGRKWTIKFVSESQMLDIEGIEGSGKGRIGLTMLRKLVIHIGDFVDEYIQKETVLHEVMHACWAGVHAEADLNHEETDAEEMFCSGLDTPLLAVMRENPALMRYLLS